MLLITINIISMLLNRVLLNNFVTDSFNIIININNNINNLLILV
jgi:hypothetical protein